MRKLRVCAFASLALLTVGGALVAEQGWLALKSRIASRLIDHALARHLRDGGVHPPWSWADTHPLALLEVPRLNLRRTVLAGASGSSLAFGPGHVDGSARPNDNGNCVVAGHRDTWFAFLGELQAGDELVLRSATGTRRYRVTATRVHSMWDTTILEPTEQTRLTLVTCYPFRGLLRSPWRYVVTARTVPEIDVRPENPGSIQKI